MKLKPRLYRKNNCWVCEHPAGFKATSAHMKLAYTNCLIRWWDCFRYYTRWS